MKIRDYVGGFLVTAGKEIEKIAKEFEDNKDDYNSILVKSLGDRIAEALAEMMHQKVRTNFWGYDINENLSNKQLINEDVYRYKTCTRLSSLSRSYTEKNTF